MFLVEEVATINKTYFFTNSPGRSFSKISAPFVCLKRQSKAKPFSVHTLNIERNKSFPGFFFSFQPRYQKTLLVAMSVHKFFINALSCFRNRLEKASMWKENTRHFLFRSFCRPEGFVSILLSLCLGTNSWKVRDLWNKNFFFLKYLTENLCERL